MIRVQVLLSLLACSTINAASYSGGGGGAGADAYSGGGGSYGGAAAVPSFSIPTGEITYNIKGLKIAMRHRYEPSKDALTGKRLRDIIDSWVLSTGQDPLPPYQITYQANSRQYILQDHMEVASAVPVGTTIELKEAVEPARGASASSSAPYAGYSG